jgi:hypothetical protein
MMCLNETHDTKLFPVFATTNTYISQIIDSPVSTTAADVMIVVVAVANYR